MIDFVMQLFGISFAQAVVRINADFGLNLTTERPDPRELEQYRLARAEKKRRAAQKKAFYLKKNTEFLRLWTAYINKAPAGPGDKYDPEYVEACRKLPALEEWLENHLNEVRL